MSAQMDNRSLRNNGNAQYAASATQSSFRDDAMSSASWPAVANDWLLKETELNFGSCHGLDQVGHFVGVGLFFIPNPEDDDAFYVSSIVPGSSAFRSGSVELFDKLLTIDDMVVEGWPLEKLRKRLLGKHGTFVDLQLVKSTDSRVYKVQARLARCAVSLFSTASHGTPLPCTWGTTEYTASKMDQCSRLHHFSEYAETKIGPGASKHVLPDGSTLAQS